MASSKSRSDKIQLQGRDIQSLKAELEIHLTTAMCRQHADVIVVANKVPMGFCCTVEPGLVYTEFFVFPVNGTLQDFISKIPDSCKDLFIEIQAVSATGTQINEARLRDGFRDYSIEVNIPAKTFCKITIRNEGKQSFEASIGFTYQQGKDYEIKEIEFNGTIEGGA